MFRNSQWYLLIALLVAGVLASCHVPTAPQSGPTLSLILPDSARAFDTVVLRAHYSDSVNPSWKFMWQFGDSSSATTTSANIAHVYDSAGTYNIHVNLVDSVSKTIAKQTGQLRVMPLNAPTLTLTIPDTVYWGDSCVMSVSSSQPLKPSWKYTWSFGDSAAFSSQQDSVLHWFLNAGTYTVRVELDDTVRHILLGSRTATILVVARHFNLALLQSMNHLDISWKAILQIDTTWAWQPSYKCSYPMNTDTFEMINPQWNDNTFGMNDSTSYDDTLNPDPSFLQLSTGSNIEHDNGQTDQECTQLSYSSSSTLTSFGGYVNTGNTFCYSYYGQTLIVQNVPFKSFSDSELIFEARGSLLKRNFYNSSFESKSNFSDLRVQTQANFSSSIAPVYFVQFRFHK